METCNVTVSLVHLTGMEEETGLSKYLYLGKIKIIFDFHYTLEYHLVWSRHSINIYGFTKNFDTPKK